MAEGDERRRALGEFFDYDGMLAVLRARVSQLQINGERFDEYAGLPRGYLSKLIGANPVRKIGMTSMGPLFAALGVSCVLIEDPAATARLKNSLPPRNGSYVRAAPRIMLTERVWRQLQKRGRQVRWSKLTPAQRSQIMRALARKRWRGP
jgi:hypothetical protein